MKTKQLILSTMAVAWGVFGATYSYAGDDEQYLDDHVRITKIEVAAPSGVAEAGSQIHFDVTMKDVPGIPGYADWRIKGMTYTPTPSAPGDHPYLSLNVPIEGESLNANTGDKLKTPEARAYFNGTSGDKIRFTYTVRPGDMVTGLTWKSANGEPVFGGKTDGLVVTVQRGPSELATTPRKLQPNMLKKYGDIETGVTKPVVSGYTFTVGGRLIDKSADTPPADEGISNEGSYGLVRVKVAVDKPCELPSGRCYVWAMKADGSKFYPVAVTNMAQPNAVVKVSPTPLGAGEDSFARISASAARLMISRLTPETPLEVLVNVPEGTDNLRICFGRKPSDLNVPTDEPQVYAYCDYIVDPVEFAESGVCNRFSIAQNPELITQTDGHFKLKTDIAAGMTDAGSSAPLALGSEVAAGGELTVAVGSEVTLKVKDNFTTPGYFGTVYATLERISADDNAGITPETYAIPLEAGKAFQLKFRGAFDPPSDPTKNETEYRIRIPGLNHRTGDKYFYLRVRSVPKKEIITISAAPDASTELRENFQNVTVVPEEQAQPAQKFIMTVEPEEDARRFLIHPITYGLDGKMVRITNDYVFVDKVNGQYRRVLDALARYVSVQQGSPSLSTNPRATLNLRVSAMATSAEFYFVAVNDDGFSGVKNRTMIKRDPVSGDLVGDPVTITGIEYVAAACNGAGVITGENDDSSPVVLNLQNRAPALNVSTSSNGSYDSPHFFQVNVSDVPSDYLVVFGRFAGMPDKESFHIYANVAEMELLYGEDGWKKQLTRIWNTYGTEFGFDSVDALLPKIEDRAKASTILMSPTFVEGREPSWQVVAFDSSFNMTEQKDILKLDQEQKILITTVVPGTVDGRGYVLWGDQTPGAGFGSYGWVFGSSYTASVIKSAGVAYINAYPFAANTPAPDPKYAAISTTRDSFFYCWKYDPKYVPALPDAANPHMPYQPALRVNSRFTLEDNKQQAGGRNSDILLSAYFVTEFLPGDAYTSFTKTASTQVNLLDLGDYNGDGVPDGWVMANLNDRTMAEETNLSTTGAAGDVLPLAGQGGGFAAYGPNNTSGTLGQYGEKGPMSPGSVFSYKMRVRGFDDALNAADGNGNWLSNPAWVVLARANFNDAHQAVVGTLVKDAAGRLTLDPNAGWQQIRLNQTGVSADPSKPIKYTANRIPYIDDGAGKYYAVGEDGNPVRNANFAILVDPGAETFTQEYTGWVILPGESGVAADAPGMTGTGVFPFAAASPEAAGDLVIDGVTVDSFRSDATTVGGVLLDEPIANDDVTRNSWLNRLRTAGNPADSDGDGMINGQEYFLWYYASRITYASVSEWTTSTGEQKKQVNTALWPAIALPKDGKLVRVKGTIGRGFNNAYGTTAENTEIWAPLDAEKVMDAFNPMTPGQRGGDIDGDGLSNEEEFALGTNPIDCDTDEDGMIDGWEVHFGLNPLKPGDANLNPDGDAFADASGVGIVERPDYHPLFRLNTVPPPPPAPGADPDPAMVRFLDPIDRIVLSVPEETAAETGPAMKRGYLTAAEAATAKLAPLAVTDTLDGTEIALYREKKPVPCTLRDHDVYLAFGFDPTTAVRSNLNGAHNTQAFTSVEEFRSAAKLANGAGFASILKFSSDPTKADTNGDGLPDGWALYVGVRAYADPEAGPEPGLLDPDGDGLVSAAEFWHSGMSVQVATVAGIEKYTDGWLNKRLPTDPYNPDTDADGIDDGSEGLLFKYTAAPGLETLSGGKPATMGLGMNPNAIDTDNDGLSDGWEAAHGISMSQVVTGQGSAERNPGEDGGATEEKPVEENQPTVTTPTDPSEYLSHYYPYLLDPTNANDVDIDPDRDGLSNAQEYYVAYLRNLRYDLGPDAARMYEHDLGKLDASGQFVAKLPDVFRAEEDFSQVQQVPSPFFTTATGAPGTQDGGSVLIDPLSVGYGVGLGQPATAVMNAIAARWNHTVLGATTDQLSAYVNVLAGGTTVERDLAKAIEALDAVLARRSADAVMAAYGDKPAFANLLDPERTARELRAAIFRVDACVRQLAGNRGGAAAPVMADYLQQDAGAGSSQIEKVWKARREQLLLSFEGQTDPVYDTVNALFTPPASLADATVYPDAGNALTIAVAYEEALRAVTNPLIRTQYRDAVRGMNGGLRIGTFDRPYFTTIGWHTPLAAFDERKANFALGMDLANAGIMVGHPFYSVNTLPLAALAFPTTSPYAIDSDMDGMDDHWEVFHGLNPILGDFMSADDQGWVEGTLSGVAYDPDRIGTVTGLKPTVDNPFANEAMDRGRVSDYNYVAYPWLAGAPFADPDGDGLANAEEGINPMGGDVARYGTDPSPLWLTDPANPNSVTARFYGARNLALNGKIAAAVPVAPRTLFLGTARVIPSSPDDPAAALLPFEVNEGFDTDGDGIDDRTELISESVLRGEPQSALSPSRQNVAYFEGKGAMQSHAASNFGPAALETFTVECWVNPAAGQSGEVVLVDRPWRYSEEADAGQALSDLRHNFQIGFRSVGGSYEPFARYTGMGTTVSGSSIDYSPMGAPEVNVRGADALPADTWTHLAVTYDGEMLTFYVNGGQRSSIKSGLIPATGVISVKNDLIGSGGEVSSAFTFRNAPILIGAAPSQKWFADFSGLDTDAAVTGFSDVYTNAFRGYIDEVRIWNGARTGNEILEAFQRTLTQPELLRFRYTAFMARALGDGVFQTNVPVEPYAIYTFDELISSTKAVSDKPWERFPGESQDQTKPGALLARRNGLVQALAGKQLDGTTDLVDASLKDALPKVEEVFESYYGRKTPALTGDPLRSKHYCVEDTANGVTTYEIVPRALNTVQHLPAMDVEVANFHLTSTLFGSTSVGSWVTPMHRDFAWSPSGDAEHLKPVDTVYWTPYAAGRTVEEKPFYNVKVASNPYAYRHLGSVYIGPDFRMVSAFTDLVPSDLFLYGDVYARYTTKSWDGSPSTDNSSGGGSGGSGGGSGGGTAAKPGDSDWFEFGSSNDPSGNNGSAWNEDQNSKGQDWLDANVGMGQTKDDDSDRLPNWWESYYTLDPADPDGDNGAHGDPDGDFLTNFGEYLAGANPLKFATAGNGVPDYHIPVWMRRGRPTFGLLYSDNDFMEDVWEAARRSSALSPDVNDGWEDADGDGWSNWAEARANFRTSRHSTDPSKKHGNAPTGATTLELPTPAFRMTVDYFGDMNVYTNAAANAQIVIHSYTAVNNNSAPDAVFTLPLAYSATAPAPEGGNAGAEDEDGEAEKPQTTGAIAQDIGMWGNGEFSGFLHVGNVIPGSFSIVYTRQLPSKIDKEGKPVPGGELSWRIESDTKQDGDTANLFYERTLYVADKHGNLTPDGQVREIVGTINYSTGFYTLSFPKTHPFWGNAKWYKKGNGHKGGEANEGAPETIGSDVLTYDGEDFSGTAYYGFRIMPGTSNTYTVVYPASGWMKEGPNNFFVFADLNGDGHWQEREPAGVPDQQNVDLGFDQINRPLHVTLSTIAPPGAIRVNVLDRISGTIDEAVEGGMGGTGGGMGDGEGGGLFPGFGGGSVGGGGMGGIGKKPVLKYPDNLGLLAPPEAGVVMPPRLIDENGNYDIAIVRRANVGLQGPSPTNPIVEFIREYNFQKPYITEDEIFSAKPAGLAGSWDANQLSTEYMVCLLPKGAAINPDTKYQEYAVAVVTNHLTKLEHEVTELIAPLGGKEIGNSEINFDWSCNVQVPTFNLKIAKLEGVTGEKDGKVVYEKTIRGVTPYASDRGNGQTLQYRYRYTLNRGVGELKDGALFGNGLYRYTLTLNPYNGSAVPMQGTFRLTMRDSISDRSNPMFNEKESVLGEINSVDSYFVRACVRYNGVLSTKEDFAGRKIFIEAHYSASFNGDPVAATSDYLVYNDSGDPADKAVADLNPYVVMTKDTKKTVSGTEVFFSTRFDAELRGLATDRTVFLMAYLDLNDNGRRDRWEPWGYATMGKDANAGFYFDPKSVKPTNRKGTAFAAEFYIQDVDSDNDHIADAWEWKSSGRPGEDFSKWCEKLTGSYGDQKGKAIWVGAADGSGTFGLTAYGAQLLGFTVKQPVTVAPNGAVEVEETIPGDMKTVTDIMDTVGLDGARDLFARGYDLYGLSVKDVRFDGETITLGWDVTAALQASDGTLTNITDMFAGRANSSATYAVYGKAALDDTEWTLLETRPIRGVTEPMARVEVTAAAAKLGDRMPAFFRVVLSAKAPAATTAE